MKLNDFGPYKPPLPDQTAPAFNHSEPFEHPSLRLGLFSLIFFGLFSHRPPVALRVCL